jgi:hypothetical protein
MPVHSMASADAASQALPDGMVAGHHHHAGSTRINAAEGWLPAATANGATPASAFFVRLEKRP